MAAPFIHTAFVAGELTPSLWGHTDLAKFAIGAATMRNLFVSYRGGAYSRAGTKFVGFSKQTGRSVPPRLIPFQFNINQGLALEFGNEYMRVIADGAFVTENTLDITAITQANPCQITASGQGATAATPIASGVVTTYAPGDLVTLAGGPFTTPAVLNVTTTQIEALNTNAVGSGYAINDTVTLAGGTQTTAPIIKVLSLASSQASGSIAFSANPNDGDTVTLNSVVWTFKTIPTGADQTQIGATLALTLLTLVSDLNASGDPSLSVATYGESGSSLTVVYDTPGTGGNSYTLAASAGTPSGANLTGGSTTGIGTFSFNNNGVFTANPAGGNFTEASTSGAGTGATFQSAILAPHAVTVSTAGVYSATPANPVAQASTTGSGSGATFTVTWGTVPGFSAGDWVFLSGIGGMTPLNGRTVIVSNPVGTTFDITDVYGDNIDSTSFPAYTSGGTAARIFTLTTPYGENDLAYLKFTQSADVMSICCWNQETGTAYEPMDLARISNSNWTLSPPQFTASIAAPVAESVATTRVSGNNLKSWAFSYCVTAVDAATQEESVASNTVSIGAAINPAESANTLTVTWKPVSGAQSYNVYRATPVVPTTSEPFSPAGALFGYVGTAIGTQFNDSNIVADFQQVPPLHENPFAPGSIIGVTMTAGGSGYSQSTVGYTLTSLAGANAVLTPVVVGGAIVAVIVQYGGENFQCGDTVAFTGGSGATGVLNIGPETGVYPGVVAYFQERRVYASTQNNPDTYFMSQPGAFTNFDARIPTIASDAITGTPWSVEVNGIQFMVSMPGGLVVMTGLSAWQLTGVGGSSLNPQPITPSNQQAQPQAYNGCSATVPPIKVDNDVLYVQAKGSIVRDLSYNFFVNIYTGADITELSSHLFTGYTIKEWAWCEEPFKIIWCVRNDGVLLSLTFLKPQEVQGWARHDTNGLFQSVCAVTEPPVDALYTCVQRFPGTHNAYMIERMDNRIWQSVEDAWCVDCGVQLAQPTPNATLTASSATGLGALTGVTNLVGGSNYSSQTTATVVDDNGIGPGTGAVPVLTIAGGVITGVSFSPEGQGYAFPRLVISDPTGQGSGASATITLDNSATLTASAGVFSSGNVGSVVRMGGGIATITEYTDSRHVTVNITSPIVQLIPNSGGVPQPQPSGSWTLTAPVTSVSGLDYLAGATVTGLADGQVVPATVVPESGIVDLPAAATSVVLGLGFQAQLQS